MRLSAVLGCIATVLLLSRCGDGKVYQEFTDFDQRYWLLNDTVKFEIDITDTLSRYNVFLNLRNSTHYPFSRLFVNYTLADTSGTNHHSGLLQDFLFDPKSGKPLGKTGLGDLYDHQLSILSNYQFKRSGPYTLRLQQFMRTDTLQGIISVGVAVERAKN